MRVIKSLCEYRSVESEIDRLGKIYLLELLQTRFGQVLVDENGAEVGTNTFRNLYKDLSKKIDPDFLGKEILTRNFIIKPGNPKDFTKGLPYDPTLAKFKKYIEKGDQGLKMEWYTGDLIRQNIVEYFRTREIEGEIELGKDVPKHQHTQEPPPDEPTNKETSRPPTTPHIETEEISSESGDQQRPRKFWMVIGAVYSILALLLVWKVVASGSPIVVPSGFSPLVVKVLPFERTTPCPDKDPLIEKEIVKHLKTVAEQKQLPISVDFANMARIPETPIDARSVGRALHADVIVYGSAEVGCPGSITLNSTGLVVDSIFSKSFGLVRLSGISSIASIPNVSVLYTGHNVLNSAWYSIFWALGVRSYDNWDYKSALKYFMLADSVHPGYGKLYAGMSYAALGQFGLAGQMYWGCRDLEKENPLLDYAQGRLYAYGFDSPMEADRNFRSMLLKSNGIPEYSLEYIRFLDYCHAHTAALDSALALVRRFPSLIIARIALGDVYANRSEWRLASNEYRTAANLAGDSFPQYYEDAIWRLLNVGAYSKVATELDEVYRDNPIHAFRMFAFLSYKIGQYRNAIIFLRGYLTFFEKDPDILEYLAFSMMWSGMDQDSVAESIRQIGYNSRFLTNRTNLLLGEFHTWNGNLDSAAFYYGKSQFGWNDANRALGFADILANHYCRVDSAAMLLSSFKKPPYSLSIQLVKYLLSPDFDATYSDSVEAYYSINLFREYALGEYSDIRPCSRCLDVSLIKDADSLMEIFRQCHFEVSEDP